MLISVFVRSCDFFIALPVSLPVCFPLGVCIILPVSTRVFSCCTPFSLVLSSYLHFSTLNRRLSIGKKSPLNFVSECPKLPPLSRRLLIQNSTPPEHSILQAQAPNARNLHCILNLYVWLQSSEEDPFGATLLAQRRLESGLSGSNCCFL